MGEAASWQQWTEQEPGEHPPQEPLNSFRLCLVLCGEAMCLPALDLPQFRGQLSEDKRAQAQTKQEHLPLPGCPSGSSPMGNTRPYPTFFLPLPLPPLSRA